MSEPYPIEPKFVERVWGSTNLSPLYPEQKKLIGEVWFQTDFPILVKFLFTDANLSLQVHPDDCDGQPGKTEMWHILDAQPDAKIYLGFKERVTKQQVRDAIAAGTLAEMMHSIPARAGDTIFTPAGVVHAIGAGIKLCEIQQNSDITYRLHDWGLGRELHIEQGLAVAETEPYEGRRECPVSCKHFEVDRLEVESELVSQTRGRHLLIALEGEGEISGKPFESGQVWMVPASASIIPKPTARLLRAHCPSAQ